MARAVATGAVLAVLAAGAAAWRAGASSRTILPTVNGRTDYWTPVSDENADSPGTLVVEWDVGRISVGNGETQSVRCAAAHSPAPPAGPAARAAP